MFEIPDAAPTWSGGTADVEPAEAGPLAMPSPTARTTSGAMNATYSHDPWTNASAAEPTVASRTPIPTARAPPILTASGVIAGVMAIMPAAAGSVARPAWKAFIPSPFGFWKYKLTTYMSALMLPATMRIASVDPTRTRLRRSCRSTSGALALRSPRTNSTSETIETAKHPRVAADTQPQSLPSLSARTTGASTSATRTVPAQSIERDRCGSRDSWTVRRASGTHAAAITASIQNRPCQPVDSTSRPPIRGPSAAPAADAAPHSVTALIWAAPDEATDSRLMPQARIVAPEAPWIIRPPTTPAALVESAISAQEATNSARPPRNTLRRPSTSPSAPEVTITAAPTSE